MSLVVRSATDTDTDAIWAILEPVFRAGQTYAIDSGITKDAALAYWLAERAYVAVDGAGYGAEILGTFYIQENRPGGGAHYCNCGYVTASGNEGKGMARAMLEFSLTEAKSLGFTAMVYNFVVESNTRAVALWQRYGFEIVGRVPGAFRPLGSTISADSLVMFRTL